MTRMALGSLRGQKKRYFSLASGIFLAVFFATALVLASASLGKTMQDDYRARMGEQDIALIDTDTTEEEILQTGIAQRVGTVEVFGEIAASPEADAARVTFGQYDETAAALAHPACLEGRMPQQAGEIALEASALNRLRLAAEVGDTVTLYFYPLVGRNQLASEPVARTYTLTGVLAEKSAHLGDQQAVYYQHYMRFPAALASEAEEIEPGSLPARHLLLELAQPLTEAQIEEAIPGQYVLFNYQRPLVGAVGISSAQLCIGIVALALLLASGMGIVNAFAANLAERSVQIGMMRAVGATRRQIRRIFGREALLLALLCAPAAIALSCLAVALLLRLLDLGALYAPPALLFAALAFSVLCVMLAAAIPLRRAGRVSPMQAIRDTQFLRAAHRARVKSQKRFRVESLAARRALVLHRGQSAGVPILLALCLLALCGAYLLVGGNLAVMQIEQEYDYELTVDSFDSWEYYDAAALRPRFTESDRADILSLPYVARVDGAQRAVCNLVLDEVTGYLRPDPALHTYLDEPTGSAWSSERREAYLTLKNELGIEGDLFGVEVNALPEERILACAGDVLHGEIDIEALNAGREVIVVAPDCVYERTQPVRGGLWISYATEPFAEREPEAQYRKFANDTFQVGQELPLCQLFAREYKLGYNWDWNIRAGALARRDASPVIGATVDWATANDMGLLYGYENGDVITTHAGLRALGLYTNGYSEFGVALAQTPPAETEAQIDEALREIASRVEGARYDSQFASLRAQREIIRNLLLAAGTVLLLFTAIALSMMDNAISGRIRADRRTIGTLRAVGAPLSAILGLYRRQVGILLAVGALAGFALSAAIFAVTHSGFKFTTFRVLPVWGLPALLAAYAAAVLLACHLGLRARLRGLPRESIVESIREL
ncbi:MAG TPA: FtsX-like permease family protein, partial [Candidatus Ornithocaccomicrobium faecavium]|nr:FtsX-like permease family protein [Candidatus Ornithocaccomicrobium faecavium]